MRIYLIELQGVDSVTENLVTLYFSDGEFVTEPTDTPANTVYEARVKQPALVRRDMYSTGTTTGQSRIGFGELILSNADGGLDYLENYGFDGQKITVKVGDPSLGLSSFSVVLTSTIEQVELTQKEFIVRIRDRQFELDEPLQTNRYLGTGSLEGNSVIKDKVKPLVYGQVFNCEPVLVDPITLIYQFADNSNVTLNELREGGLVYTRGADYANQTELLTITPAAGQYRVFQGYFRMGSTPVGVLTFDAQQGLVTDRTVAQILKALAIKVGIPSMEINASDITALDALNSSVIGLYVNEELTAIQAMDEVANSIGAYFGFDQIGMFRVGRLTDPIGTPVFEITEDLIIGNNLDRQVSNDTDRGIPAYRVTLSYFKNYTTQGVSDLLLGVNDSEIQEYSQEFKKVSSEDLAVLNVHKLASELFRTTLLVNQTDAQNESDRLLALYSTRRDVYQVTVRLDDEFISQLDVGEIVSIKYRRFNLNLGKNFVIIGLEVDYQLNRASLTLWG